MGKGWLGAPSEALAQSAKIQRAQALRRGVQGAKPPGSSGAFQCE